MQALKDKGFEFVTVSDLIYKEDYTIDANGEQSAVEKSGKFTDEEIQAVMAEYSEQIKAAGLSDQQIAQVVEALKNGEELPEELKPLAAEVMAKIESGVSESTESGNNAESAVSGTEEQDIK